MAFALFHNEGMKSVTSADHYVKYSACLPRSQTVIFINPWYDRIRYRSL